MMRRGPDSKFAPQDIHQIQLSRLMIQPVQVHMVYAVVHHAQVLLIRCHAHAADMGPEIPLCHTAQTFMENTVRDGADAAVRLNAEHCHLAVVIAAHKQKLIGGIGGYETASHALDPYLINRFQIAVRQDPERLHALIGDGIQKLLVVCLGQMRGNC